MSHDESLFDLIRHPLKVRALEVKRVVALTPRMRRITLGGQELAGFTSRAPEDHVKIFFPRPGETRPALPAMGPLGLALPSLGPRPIGRDYTPRRYDAEAGELDVDFFLHGRGVASAWAARAAPGQVLGVAGPRGSYVLKRDLRAQIFVGDETAQPEIARRIEELPAETAVHVVALANGPEEEQPWPARGSIEARWVHRTSPGANASAALVDAVRALSLRFPPSDTFAWLAGEAAEMRAVHRALVGERALPVSQVRASGHWKRGVVAHDHHEPVTLEAR